MAVSPSAVREVLSSATHLADMRQGSPVRAGAWLHEQGEVVTTWHHHDLHQLQFAFEGSVMVETERERHLLPPQRAVWIPAGVDHRTTLRSAVRTGSVFFAPDMVVEQSPDVRVIPVAPVAREMIIHSMRWPIDRAGSDPTADAFFVALAQLTSEWLRDEGLFRLPVSRDPAVSAAIAWTDEDLAGATLAGACRAAGLSERTLRRRFPEETGMTWQDYRTASRMVRAMVLFGDGSVPSVIDVATSVGFDSVSAFTRAFRGFTGENPAAYRRRIGAAHK